MLTDEFIWNHELEDGEMQNNGCLRLPGSDRLVFLFAEMYGEALDKLVHFPFLLPKRFCCSNPLDTPSPRLGNPQTFMVFGCSCLLN